MPTPSALLSKRGRGHSVSGNSPALWLVRGETQSSPRLIAPQKLVQLELKPYCNSIFNDPIRKFSGIQLSITRRHQYVGNLVVETKFITFHLGPFVILAIAEYKFHLIMRVQVRHVLPQIAVGFCGRGGFQIDYFDHAQVDVRYFQGTTRLQGNIHVQIAKRAEKSMHVGLRKRLPAGDGNVADFIARHLLDDVADTVLAATGKRILAVTVHATQRASGQAYKHSRHTNGVGLTLQGQKDFGDS